MAPPFFVAVVNNEWLLLTKRSTEVLLYLN